ncbi:MAG: carbohydrate-binding family 9-like protein [Fimbriimonadales bacterium]
MLPLCIFIATAGPLDNPPHPNGYVCGRGTPSIDGRLADPAWEDAPWTEDFVDIEGNLKPLPRFKTHAKMLWNDEYFYVGVEMEEPHVWATLTKHDSVIFYDNDFEVFVDPDADNQNYYEIEINALNTEWDLRLPKAYRDGGPALDSWEIPGLRHAVHVEGTLNNPHDTDKGWSVEIAIPWKALGEFAVCPSPPAEGDQWRVNLSRVEWTTDIVDGKYVKIPKRREDNWVWSPQWVIDMHQPQMWGYVRFATSKADFRQDETHVARMFLHRVYYKQKERVSKGFAGSLAALGLKPPDGVFLREPRVFITPTGYEASGIVSVEGKPRRLTIREDSRIILE